MDSFFGKHTKERFSCSSSLNNQQENSIEEEILREISTNLASKMDGLKTLFNDMQVNIDNIERRTPESSIIFNGQY
jgi:hypothetical protein